MLHKSLRIVVSTCVLIFMPDLKKISFLKEHLFFFFLQKKNTIKKTFFSSLGSNKGGANLVHIVSSGKNSGDGRVDGAD